MIGVQTERSQAVAGAFGSLQRQQKLRVGIEMYMTSCAFTKVDMKARSGATRVGGVVLHHSCFFLRGVEISWESAQVFDDIFFIPWAPI